MLLLLDLALLGRDLRLHLLALLHETRLDGRHVFLRDARAHDLLHGLLDLHDLLHLDDLLLDDDLLLLRLLGRRGLLLLRLLHLGRLRGRRRPRRGGGAIRQLHAQAGDLVLELADHRVLRVLVDLGLVLDALRPVGVSQGAQGLVVVVVHGADARAHHGLGVAAEGVLKQPGQLRVSVGDEGGLGVNQGGDHVAERAEGHVDLRGLLQRLPARSRLALALGARQVHHVHLAHADVVLGIGARLRRLDGDGEDGVRPAGLVVHLRAGDAAVLLPHLHDLPQVVDALDDQVGQVLHEDAALRVVFQLQLRLGVLGEEIADLLIVDL
mmetsp:Transcript_50475/g.156169  ORF Transcript_50475/g.156169 Transcript_50475/m.156169 type:complete len:325 (+) Transcript_50475:972-1946(+)